MEQNFSELVIVENGFSNDDFDLITIDLETDSSLSSEICDMEFREFENIVKTLQRSLDNMYELTEILDCRYRVSIEKAFHPCDRAAASLDIPCLLEKIEKIRGHILLRLRQLTRENEEYAQNSHSRETFQLHMRVTLCKCVIDRFLDVISLLDHVHCKHCERVKESLEKCVSQFDKNVMKEDIFFAIRTGKIDAILESCTGSSDENLYEREKLRNEINKLGKKENDVLSLGEKIKSWHNCFLK